MISPPFKVWSINFTNQNHCLNFQTINNETWTTPQACPTIYKSNPGKSIPLEMTTSYLNCPEKQHVPTPMQHVFPQTRSFDPLWLSSWRESDLLLESSLGNGNSNRRTTQQHGKTNNHSKTNKKNMHSNPSRIQSKISVLTEIEVTLQSIQDTEYLHKTQTKFRKNSHECGMTRLIGLSKTQSTKTQLLSNASPPFANASRDAGNPLHWQVNLESATRQLFSSHCGTIQWIWQLHNL